MLAPSFDSPYLFAGTYLSAHCYTLRACACLIIFLSPEPLWYFLALDFFSYLSAHVYIIMTYYLKKKKKVLSLFLVNLDITFKDSKHRCICSKANMRG